MNPRRILATDTETDAEQGYGRVWQAWSCIPEILVAKYLNLTRVTKESGLFGMKIPK